MSCLVFGFDRELADWAASKIPHVHGDFGPCAAIGVMRGNDPSDMSAPLQAVMVYSSYMEHEKTIQMSLASVTPMFARRGIMAALFHYPFEQLGVNMIWSAVPHLNDKTIRFCEHLGLKRDGVLRHRYGWKSHAVVLSMTKYEYVKVWKSGQHLQQGRPVSTEAA